MSTNDRSQEDGLAIFTLRPGNIASVMNVDTPDWGEQTWIYTERWKAPEPDPEGARKGLGFLELPSAVQAGIQEHFGRVFALPLESRDAFMKACVPQRIEVDWEVYSYVQDQIASNRSNAPKMR